MTFAIKNKAKWTIWVAMLLLVCFTTLIFGLIFAKAEDEKVELFTYDEQTTVEYGFTAEKSYLDKVYKGVKVTSTHANTVKLNRPIDISENTKDDVLTEFVTLPNNAPSQDDFASLTITLTDAENPNDSVRILVYTGNSSMYVSTWLVAVSVAPPGTNTYCFRSSGTGLPTSGYTMGGRLFHGTSFSGDGVVGRNDEGGNATALRIYYDRETSCIYAANDKEAHREPELVADLRDSAYTGIDNEWYGFASNKVYVSYTAEEVSAMEFSYLITNINGQSYAESYPKDEKAPVLKVDLEGYETLPFGEVGKAYPLFNANAYDDLDGEIMPNIKVGKNGKEYAVDKTNQTFLPDEAGTYLIEYTATDKAGLTSYQSVRIVVREYISPLTFTFDVKEGEFDLETQTSCFVGETIRLPSGIIEGGSGKTQLEVRVEYVAVGSSTRHTVVIKDFSFKADKYGYYVVTYKASDYLNNQDGGEYWIYPVYGEQPIVEYPSVPKYMIIGKKYQLNDFVAMVYEKDSASGITAIKTITVTDGDSSLSYSSDNAIYTAKGTEGEAITVTYKAVNPKNSTAYVEKSFSVTLVSPRSFIEYFRALEGNVNGRYDYSKMVTSYETENDVKMAFLNALPARNFEFWTLIKQSYANYEAITLTLTDSIDESKKIVLRIEKQGMYPALYLNGEYVCVMDGVFGRADEIEGTDGSIKVKIDGNYKVSDSTGATLCKLTKTVKGLDFEGFTSGKVYLDVELSGVNGKAGFELLSLCSQILMDENLDANGPVITLQNSIASEYNVAEKVNIPIVSAIDVLDPYTEITVSVMNKETNEYQKDVNGIELKDVKLASGLYFVPFKTGEYTIRYVGTDAQGNPTTQSYTFTVGERTDPVIIISGDVVEWVLCGKEVNLPTATVWDNTDTDILLHVYYIAPDGKVVNIDDFSFTATQKGVYRVYYYACDEYQNYSLKSYTIVSE